MFCLRILKIMKIRSDINVRFFFQKKAELNERRRLKAFLAEVLKQKGKKTSGEVRVIFCSDDELLQINRGFLKHDYYTDIVTFPFTSSKEKLIDAELYISVDRVKENAALDRVRFERELHRVIFHGILHLCGLEDKTGLDKRKMRKAEESLLTQYFDVPHNTVSA